MDLALFASIAGLFFLLLVLKRVFNAEFCVLCGSIFLTWVVFLIGFHFWSWRWTPLAALLLGQSVLGVYYYLSNRVGVFKLPTLLSLTYIAYLLMLPENVGWSVPILLILLWSIFGIIYMGDRFKTVKALSQKIIECCRDW